MKIDFPSVAISELSHFLVGLKHYSQFEALFPNSTT